MLNLKEKKQHHIGDQKLHLMTKEQRHLVKDS